MTAVMSPQQSPTSSPRQNQSPINFNPPSLPPLNTNHPVRRTTPQQPQSYAKNRISSYSNTSKLSESRSRPVSYAFPAFHSTLAYTLVRDFAYSIGHPWHYGPPPEPSPAPSTPASERQRRLSDPANATRDGSNSQWSAGPWGGDGFFQQLPQMAYGDGPPYSEDEDLHSPVVVSSRHKKHKSNFATASSGQGKGIGRPSGKDVEEEDDISHLGNREGPRSYFAGINGEGLDTYYIGEEDESANGPGGELVTYPPDEGSHPLLAPNIYTKPSHRDSHFATTLPNRSYTQGELSESSEDDEDSREGTSNRDSRYSKDYQFTIASPDEEMHGKAVALFDFAHENENELPLTEGQVIWVSYRHGQGWLVAEDPKTGDTGLVPEEYVRLVRHIEGGLTYLSGEQDVEGGGASASPVTAAPADSAITPTQADVEQHHHNNPSNSNGTNGAEIRPPIVSTFSTSSKDLKPYPHHLLDEQARGSPPQVVHYGSQSNTPTIASPAAGAHGPRGFEEVRGTEDLTEEEEEEESEAESHPKR